MLCVALTAAVHSRGVGYALFTLALMLFVASLIAERRKRRGG
jgi:uncharacterized membrane protein YtjA (UPF0391 family)